MGCGHSKINIYPRKSRSKTNSKKSVTAEKAESEEEEGVEPEPENPEDSEDCDKKTIKFKPFGGPLLAQAEISTSQQDFFKMLDDKIQNGPDYDSEGELERAEETARLRALLRDWETASAGSRSLPATPKRRPAWRGDGAVRSADPPPDRRVYVSQIPPSVIHQSYGVAQPQYRQLTYNNPNYVNQSPSHQMASYPSAMQYQAISPMYAAQPPMRHHQAGYQVNPAKAFIGNPSPNHIPYDQPVAYSPAHRVYGVQGTPPPTVALKNTDLGYKGAYTNGELVQQQQLLYNQHSMQYQQYKEAREQVLAQNQGPQGPQLHYRAAPKGYGLPAAAAKGPQQGEAVGLGGQRKQYELT
ncbi:unnamed protein product [Phyllotreta striolata]|uniref:Uncharacterized protein n=1 Tax=Phyllotreta striolata TaxID=444603 RepID=A0A9N9TIZ0_PHYSR|nr:unnamed protein product [Phyllotreta striolata]